MGTKIIQDGFGRGEGFLTERDCPLLLSRAQHPLHNYQGVGLIAEQVSEDEYDGLNSSAAADPELHRLDAAVAD